MNPAIRPPDRDEPALTSPELRGLVDSIRATPAPVLRVTPEAIFAGYEARRDGRRRTLGAVALALAAGLALVWSRGSTPVSVETGPEAQVAVREAPAPEALPTPAAPELAPAPAPVTLSAAVRVTVEEGPPPTVLAAWEVGLAPGRYEVRVDEHEGPEVLLARTSGGVLELHHGHVAIVVAGDHAEATLKTGVATWVAPDGARRPLEQDVPPDMAEGPATPATAAGLARKAEDLLAAGKRDAAVPVLRQLVTGFPQSAHARGALLDLARLLKASSRADEARCAYQLYLARYPGKEQLADEVQKALERLGEGPACRGLRPR